MCCIVFLKDIAGGNLVNYGFWHYFVVAAEVKVLRYNSDAKQ